MLLYMEAKLRTGVSFVSVLSFLNSVCAAEKRIIQGFEENGCRAIQHNGENTKIKK